MSRIDPLTPSAPNGPQGYAKVSKAPDFAAALLNAAELLELPLDKRPPLLGKWMKQGDLGYLFAPRGAGKSWMAMLIGKSIAEGASLGDWERGEEAQAVFYFDAEMNLADVQERARKLCIESLNFKWLSNERLFMQGGAGVNIASVEHQARLSAMLTDGSVFIIDNLSTAQLGMDENDNDSFDAIRDWLLSLRQRGITILIVHHAGRNGQMRGSSRREDMAHWIISLKDTSDDDRKAKSFTTSFIKVRNCPEREAPVLQWTLKDEGETISSVCQPFSGPEALCALICEGHTKATLIAEEMGVRPSTVSKWARKLADAGRITIKGREYTPAS